MILKNVGWAVIVCHLSVISEMIHNYEIVSAWLHQWKELPTTGCESQAVIRGGVRRLWSVRTSIPWQRGVRRGCHVSSTPQSRA